MENEKSIIVGTVGNGQTVTTTLGKVFFGSPAPSVALQRSTLQSHSNICRGQFGKTVFPASQCQMCLRNQNSPPPALPFKGQRWEPGIKKYRAPALWPLSWLATIHIEINTYQQLLLEIHPGPRQRNNSKWHGHGCIGMCQRCGTRQKM